MLHAFKAILEALTLKIYRGSRIFFKWNLVIDCAGDLWKIMVIKSTIPQVCDHHTLVHDVSYKMEHLTCFPFHQLQLFPTAKHFFSGYRQLLLCALPLGPLFQENIIAHITADKTIIIQYFQGSNWHSAMYNLHIILDQITKIAHHFINNVQGYN